MILYLSEIDHTVECKVANQDEKILLGEKRCVHQCMSASDNLVEESKRVDVMLHNVSQVLSYHRRQWLYSCTNAGLQSGALFPLAIYQTIDIFCQEVAPVCQFIPDEYKYITRQYSLYAKPSISVLLVASACQFTCELQAAFSVDKTNMHSRSMIRLF